MNFQPRHFIDGAWSDDLSSPRIEVVTPSTGAVLGHAADASAEVVASAVDSARRTFDETAWSSLSLVERAAVIERAADLLEPRVDDVAHLLTAQMGAPITVAKGMITGGLGTMRFLAQCAREYSLVDVRDTDRGSAAVVKTPVGVVAAIAPWNGPWGMAIGKIIPALLAGCTVVFKPAPETPFDVGYLADALTEAGLPAGVLNVVTGGPDTGRALVEHPGIDKISFTGSTVAGQRIAETVSTRFVRTQLELGGKSAAIVLDDADMASVTAGIGTGCFFNSGQVCAALSRVLAPRSRYGEVVTAVEKAASSWTPGDPFDPKTTLGPLVSRRQRDRVENYIRLGRETGARLVSGGGRPAGMDSGWYVEPTVFADVDNSMRIAREEIFGPVVVVIPYDDLDDAVSIANDSDFGLHGAVFTRDPQRALDVAQRINAGTFSINNFVYNNRVPFGGVKSSGIGRDSGIEGFEAYFELKTINFDETTRAALPSLRVGASE
ncbi:aldehyde dehydrogenase [Rhodococcus olei]|uniref:aldehyde dehydrogenase (NAD(+)) n=1 Tax=Rhodococcus olei TaxID=2161675 RepID=A0ABP8NYD3_9NOCA